QIIRRVINDFRDICDAVLAQIQIGHDVTPKGTVGKGAVSGGLKFIGVFVTVSCFSCKNPAP
ncbi:MAG: hypothetical protein KKE72_00830, partial [Gammaproteobacteria bacterium]|nr:hypothetical protein [Gammaproteobacteria bacterium]